jgi:hypothetical protein
MAKTKSATTGAIDGVMKRLRDAFGLPSLLRS